MNEEDNSENNGLFWKSISSLFITALVIGGIALLVMQLPMLLKAIMPWISENLYPWTDQAAKIALFFVVPSCSVLFVFERTNTMGIGRFGLLLSMGIIVFNLRVWSLIVAYTLAGVFWVIFALILDRFLAIRINGIHTNSIVETELSINHEVLVICLAIAAAALSGQWSVVGQMLIQGSIVYGLSWVYVHVP